jgi:tetratricopeptide (TPR) repeat protein
LKAQCNWKLKATAWLSDKNVSEFIAFSSVTEADRERAQMSDNNLPQKILVVDDDPSVAQALEGPMSRYNIKVEKATTLETALYLFNQQRFEVAIVEIEFEPLPGLALVQRWREHELEEKRCAGIILTSGNKTLGKNEGLIRELGDLEVLNKPFSTVQILPYLSRALATHRRLLAYRDMKGKIDGYYTKTGDFEKAAIQVQKRLPELGPKGLNMLYDLYEKADRLDAALMIVAPLLEREPNNIALLNAMGRMLMRQGKCDKAKVYMEKADQLAPDNINRMSEMAEMYLNVKEPDKTIEKYKQILKLMPDSTGEKFKMFGRLFDEGFGSEAVDFGKECANPMEIVRHYNNKGVIHSRDNKTDDALEEYMRALQFYPTFKENYRIYYNIALANMQTKSRETFEEAEKNLLKCLELAPKFEKASKALEMVAKALGRKAS